MKDIEARSCQIATEKSKLETVSNYYEGLLYQKNNIEREILNCKNVSLPQLDKLDDLKGLLEDLGKRVDPLEIEALDQVKVSNTENIRASCSRIEEEAADETRIRKTLEHRQRKIGHFIPKKSEFRRTPQHNETNRK